MRNEERKINTHIQSTVTQGNQSGIEESYYSVGGIEVKDIQKAKMPPKLSLIGGWYWANVVKYVLRCGWKGSILKDLKKAKDYLNWLIEDVEKNSEG